MSIIIFELSLLTLLFSTSFSKRSFLAPSNLFFYINICPIVLGVNIWLLFFHQLITTQAFYYGSISVALFGSGFLISHIYTSSKFILFKIKPKKIISISPTTLWLISTLLYYFIQTLVSLKIGLFPFEDPLRFRILGSHKFGFIYVFIGIGICLSFYLYLSIQSSKLKTFVITPVTLFTIVSYIFISGGRSSIISFLFITVLYRFVTQGFRLKPYHYIILGSALLTFFLIYSILREGWSSNQEMNSIDYGYYFLEIFLRFDALFNYLKVLSDNSIEVLSYGIEPIKLAIFTLVPRTFWDSKPFSISLILQKHFTADLDNLKQGYFFSSAYYLSEAYLVFGLIGPFLYGTIQGFFIKVLDNSYLFNLKLKQFGPFCMYYIFVFLSLDIALEGFSGMKFQLIIGYLGFIYILFLANFFNFKQTSKY